MERENHRPSREAFCRRLNLLNVFSIVEQRNNQKQYQRLNYESSHVKGEQITYFKFSVNTVKIKWESNGEDNQH